MKAIGYLAIGLGLGASAGFAAGALLSSKKSKAELDELSAQNQRLSERVDKAERACRKAEQETEEKEDVNEGESEIEPEGPAYTNDADICRLTEEEFENSTSFRDFQSLVYYEKDGVLCSERGRAFGKDEALETVGELTAYDIEQNDTIWVLNKELDEMFEILIEREESYY